MENNNEELTALTNSLNYYNLEGYKIHEYFQQDKRIKIKLYFLTDEKGKSLTGHWRYIELNHFIHGLGTAKKIFCNSINEYDKLKEDNAVLLNALRRIDAISFQKNEWKDFKEINNICVHTLQQIKNK